MEFKDWMEDEEFAFGDAYGQFLDAVLSENLDLREDQSPTTMRVEFVLEESRPRKKETPWGSETWLDTDNNQKIEKTKGVKAFRMGGKRVLFVPYIINLLPAKQSGINLCICATKHCAATCLHSAGNIGALMDKTMSRLRKSWFIALDRERAFGQIANQIENKKKEVDEFNASSKTEHKQMVIRLNGTSDLIWRTLTDESGLNIFEMFPDVVFYDYAKTSEMKHFIRGEVLDDEGKPIGKFPPNYHITLSYGGSGGIKNYRETLEAGENLAVPFAPGKSASQDYMEFPKDMRHLIRGPSRPRKKKEDGPEPPGKKKQSTKEIYFPDHVKSRREKDEYIDMVMERIKKEGNFVSPEELAPFAGQTLLPGLFMCHEVIDGDDHDARFLDDLMLPRSNLPNDADEQPEMEISRWERTRKKHGVVVGLTAKGDLTFTAYKGKDGWDANYTGFMVGPEDPEMNSPCKPMLNDPSREAFLRKKTEVYRKVAKAIMTIRNLDARHLHAHEMGAFGRTPRTHVRRTEKGEPVQTYMTSKGRITKEMNELIDVIQAVMRGQEPNIQGEKTKKMAGIASAAAKLRKYLTDPETVKMLNDDEFKKKARAFGIDVSFESLARAVDMDARRDPTGPKRTLLPPEMLSNLGRKPENPE
jgi:hypothetical protein